jgi:hypothetical protein
MTIQIPAYLQNKAYGARTDRQVMSDGLQPGVSGETFYDFLCSPTGNTREMTTYGGTAYVKGNTTPNQGMYRVFDDTALLTPSVTLVHDAVTTSPRLDQIIIRVQDSSENGNVGPDIATIEIVKGVETSGATLDNRSGAIADASLPKNCLRICDVLITVGVGSLASNYRNRRTTARHSTRNINLAYDSPVLSSTPVGCGLSNDPTSTIAVEAGPNQEIYFDYVAHLETTSTTSSLVAYVECIDPSGTVRSGPSATFKGSPTFFGPNIPAGARVSVAGNGTAGVQYYVAPGTWKFRLMAYAAAGTGYVRFNGRDARFNITVVNAQETL